MPDVFLVIVRWMHIASMAALIGGILYGRLVMIPAMAALAPDARETLAERAAAAYRPIVLAAMSGLIISGFINILVTPGHRQIYHILLGIKLLLVMHVFAVALLIVRPKNARRARMMTGVIISGLVIILISAWLRRNF
jgi:uncharacterized membrane protein